MLSVRGRRGVPDRALAIRLATIAACAAAFVCSFTQNAVADSISAKRAEAAAAANRIQQFYTQVEAAQQAYDGATLRLHETNVLIRANLDELAAARSNLKVAYHNLAGALVSAYKNGQPDLLQTVLSAHSLSQMLDEIELVHRTNSFDASLVQKVRQFKHQVVLRKAELAKEKAARVQAVHDQLARRAEARTALSNERSYYNSLQRSIKLLIAQKRAAEAAAAAARAAAAQQATQVAQHQTQNTVTVGGSVPGTPTVGTTPAVTLPSPTGVAAAAASAALGEQGVPYVWGGSSPSGFDCSGLVVWAFAQAGLGGLPHYTGALWNVGVHVDQSQLAVGDLVFFDGLGHVGIYVGGGNFVHAPHTGTTVTVSSLSDSWYSSNYDGAVRVTG